MLAIQKTPDYILNIAMFKTLALASKLWKKWHGELGSHMVLFIPFDYNRTQKKTKCDRWLIGDWNFNDKEELLFKAHRYFDDIFNINDENANAVEQIINAIWNARNNPFIALYVGESCTKFIHGKFAKRSDTTHIGTTYMHLFTIPREHAIF